MINKILDNYFSKKLQKQILDSLAVFYLDKKFVKGSNGYIELQVKRTYYDKKEYKAIFCYNPKQALDFLININHIEDKLHYAIKRSLEVNDI